MKYLLGSGYYQGNSSQQSEEFAKVWARNLRDFTTPHPERVVIISVGASYYPISALATLPCPSDLISLDGNLGHVHHLIHKLKPHYLGGWSASVIALAMIAYNAELDFIYREQDVLAFGPYVERMYSEIGDAKMIFGSIREMPCAQSLFLIKHDFIPDFIRDYMMLGNDRDIQSLPEHKFKKLEESSPLLYRRFGFGYDRDRPFNTDDTVWYAQQLSAEEMRGLYRKGLL
jgi:hypothetical protein